MELTHGALFNGIAGFPLAASWAGIPTKWTVEIDEFCNKVSKKHFPDAIQYTDIRTVKNLPYVDIISGGFPCQPYSVAGKQLAGADDRALWPENLRIIREGKPAYFIGENVTGIIGLAIDEIIASLEAEGYTCETFIVPACAVGAQHRRDRVWIVAYSYSEGFFGRGYGELLEEASVRQTQVLPCASSFKRNALSQPLLPRGNNGLPNRVDRTRALGNAIVPQVAYQLFQAIIQHAQQ